MRLHGETRRKQLKIIDFSVIRGIIVRKILVISALLLSTSAQAELPWLKDLAGDRELPRPWGVSVDFFTMDQVYAVDRLEFQIPGVNLDDTSLLDVDNKVQHLDIKGDVWLLPFLNVFGIIGKIDAETTVDLARTGLPLPTSQFLVDYDGEVYGGGFVLAGGGEHWFASVTTTITDTEISGGFESNVESLTIQPRIGLRRNGWEYWIGGLYLDTEEQHSGAVEIPFVGMVPFAVDLSEQDELNYGVGVHTMLGDHVELSFEVGFGDRTHTLLNLGYRF